MAKRMRKQIEVFGFYNGLDSLAAMLSLLRWESFLVGIFLLTTALDISSDQHCVVIGNHFLEDGAVYFCGFLGSCNACLPFLLIGCLRAAASGQTSIFTPDFYRIFSNLRIMFKWETILLGNCLPESSIFQHLVDLREGTDICNL